MGVTPLGIPIHCQPPVSGERRSASRSATSFRTCNAGWAGGRKMVQPGVTSAVTTGRTHLIAGPRGLWRSGRRWTNPVRAEDGRDRHSFRTQIHRERGTGRIRAGGRPWWRETWSIAHRAVSNRPARSTTMELEERPDIVVGQLASRRPRDLWQGSSPSTTAGMVVKDGGTLIFSPRAPRESHRSHDWWIRHR